jgi:hypothetical protein
MRKKDFDLKTPNDTKDSKKIFLKNFIESKNKRILLYLIIFLIPLIFVILWGIWGILYIINYLENVSNFDQFQITLTLIQDWRFISIFISLTPMILLLNYMNKMKNIFKIKKENQIEDDIMNKGTKIVLILMVIGIILIILGIPFYWYFLTY